MKLGHVLPGSPRCDTVNALSGDGEHLAQGQRGVSGGFQRANIQHVDFCDFMVVALNTARNTFWMNPKWMAVSCQATSLLHHICRVLFGCGKEQVVRAYARTHITLMGYQHSGWYCAVFQFVCNAVGFMDAPIDTEITIASGGRGCPRPAPVSLYNLLPEPGFCNGIHHLKLYREVVA